MISSIRKWILIKLKGVEEDVYNNLLRRESGYQSVIKTLSEKYPEDVVVLLRQEDVEFKLKNIQPSTVVLAGDYITMNNVTIKTPCKDVNYCFGLFGSNCSIQNNYVYNEPYEKLLNTCTELKQELHELKQKYEPCDELGEDL